MNRSMFALVALAGCTSLDEGVMVEVVSATIAAEPSMPDSLATVDVIVRMVADTVAEHELALDRVALDIPGETFQADLAVTEFAPFWIYANETKEVTLANVATTSAELAPLCGRSMNLFVYIIYLDESSGTRTSGTLDGTPVAIACP